MQSLTYLPAICCVSTAGVPYNRSVISYVQTRKRRNKELTKPIVLVMQIESSVAFVPESKLIKR